VQQQRVINVTLFCGVGSISTPNCRLKS